MGNKKSAPRMARFFSPAPFDPHSSLSYQLQQTMSDRPLPASRRASRRAGADGESQFRLLRERRFAPFFWTQFLGAMNDNVFKVGFTSLVTFQAARFSGVDPKTAAFLISAIFIVPFVLFSATSGQVADKYDKATLTRLVKTFEIAVMLVGGAGFLAAQRGAAVCLHVPDGRPLDRVRAGQVRVSAATPGLVGTRGRQRPRRDGDVRRDPDRHDHRRGGGGADRARRDAARGRVSSRSR